MNNFNIDSQIQLTNKFYQDSNFLDKTNKVLCLNTRYLDLTTNPIVWDPTNNLQCSISEHTTDISNLVIPYYKSPVYAGDILQSYTLINPKNKQEYNITLDFDFGQMLGIIIGDGWWDKPQYGSRKMYIRYLYIADVPGTNYKFIEDYLVNKLHVTNYKVKEQFFPKGTTGIEGESRKFSIMFDELPAFIDFFDKHIGGQKSEFSNGADVKHLPLFYLNTPFEFKKGLFSGIIASDGTVVLQQKESRPKPSLYIAVTTISKRLANELTNMLESMLINTHIHEDKRKTITGNQVYIVLPSLVTTKKLNLLDQCSSIHKRDNFLNSEVDMSATSIRYDNVIVPDNIVKILRYFVSNPKMSNKVKEDVELKEKISYQKSHYAIFEDVKKTNLITRLAAKKLLNFVKEMSIINEEKFNRCIKLIEFISEKLDKSYQLTEEDYKVISEGFSACLPNYSNESLKEIFKEMESIKRTLRRYLNKKILVSKQSILTPLTTFISKLKVSSFKNYPELKQWEDKIINNELVAWTKSNG